jgi:ATP-dependent Clp protease ATP-binding subunit ClpB
VLQRELQDPLAMLLLEGKLSEGERIHVDADDGGLLIEGVPVAVAA